MTQALYAHMNNKIKKNNLAIVITEVIWLMLKFTSATVDSYPLLKILITIQKRPWSLVRTAEISHTDLVFYSSQIYFWISSPLTAHRKAHIKHILIVLFFT
jgi:hypothetical protein